MERPELVGGHVGLMALIGSRGHAMVLGVAMFAVACSAPPPQPRGNAAEVTRLGEVVAIVRDLRITAFEDGAHCRHLAYARGAFGFPEEPDCLGDGVRPFDPIAQADHTRLTQAITVSGVGTYRIREATFAADGELESAWFALHDASIVDDWDYLYDPAGVVPKRDQPGLIDFTQVDQEWWFVWTRDD